MLFLAAASVTIYPCTKKLGLPMLRRIIGRAPKKSFGGGSRRSESCKSFCLSVRIGLWESLVRVLVILLQRYFGLSKNIPLQVVAADHHDHPAVLLLLLVLLIHLSKNIPLQLARLTTTTTLLMPQLPPFLRSCGHAAYVVWACRARGGLLL